MNDIRRYSIAAVVLLVILRISLGWQLLYEGLWKVNTLDSPKPWTSAGYLKNSTGPMRSTFRELAGDPNDLDWLDNDKVSKRWTAWATRFAKHYQLDEKQQKALDGLLYGRPSKDGEELVFAEALNSLPEDIGKWPVSEKIVRFDAKAKRLYVSTNYFMTPSDRQKLEKLVDGRKDEASAAFRKAVARLDDRQKKTMGYLRKLSGAVNGNPDLLGNEKWQRLGEKDEYIQLLKEYEAQYAKASTTSEWNHLSYLSENEIQPLRVKISSPVKAMQAEFYEDAEGLLTLDQLGTSQMPASWTAVKVADTLTILGLTMLGLMLILGLFTRFSCVIAAFMLFNFYLAMPPWPGTPPVPGPEHSFIINKNLIEVIALLTLATMPSGIWFGLDGLLSRFFRNWKSDSKKMNAQKSTIEVEATADKPAASAK